MLISVGAVVSTSRQQIHRIRNHREETSEFFIPGHLRVFIHNAGVPLILDNADIPSRDRQRWNTRRRRKGKDIAIHELVVLQSANLWKIVSGASGNLTEFNNPALDPLFIKIIKPNLFYTLFSLKQQSNCQSTSDVTQPHDIHFRRSWKGHPAYGVFPVWRVNIDEKGFQGSKGLNKV